MKSLLFATFLFLANCGAFAEVSTTVHVQTDIKCIVKGVDLGKKSYSVDVPVTIYEKDGSPTWGTGLFKYDYAHPTSTMIRIFSGHDLNATSKFAMRFSTFVNVYTGADWGTESSIVYFDSFKHFSPISQSGIIFTSADKNDFCDIQALMSPTAGP